MFGSEILEVGIGLILVFLLVSLILTAVRETLEGWTKTRARDLELALAELLEDERGTGARAALYSHPLIYSLFPGEVRPTSFSAGRVDPLAAPSGATAAAGGDGTEPLGAPPASAGGGTAPSGATAASGGGGAAPSGSPSAQQGNLARLWSSIPSPRLPHAMRRRPSRNLPSYIPRESFALALEDLLSNRGAVGRLGEAYQALLRAAGGDPAQVRKGLEQWYDAAMDRAAGWYKRRTQTILFWLGLIIAVALNINALTIARYLATDDAARQRMVAIGERLATDERVAAEMARLAAEETQDSAQPQVPDQPPSGGSTTPGTPKGDERQVPDQPAPRGTTAAGTLPGAQAGSATPPRTQNENEVARQSRERERIARDLHDSFRNAQLPIGWSSAERARLNRQLGPTDTAAQVGRFIPGFLMLIAGYFIIAFAATLGAPFWFDLLGKFMVVRSTVKPTEKSPDEVSKDGGTGGSPVQPQRGGGGGSDAAPASGPGITSPPQDRAETSPQPVIFG